MAFWSTNEHLHAAGLIAKTRPELESDDYRMRREQMNRGSGKPIDPTDVYEPPDPALDPLTGIPLAKTRPDLESDDYRMRREQMNRGKNKKIDPTDVYEPPDPGLDPLTGVPLAGIDPRTGGYIDNEYLDWLKKTSPELFQDPDPTAAPGDKEWRPKPGTDPLTGQPLVKGREPNKEDAPYRPKPPGGPPWPGYPNPMPPGAPPTKLALNTSEEEDAELYERYKELQDPQAPSEEDLINMPVELAQGLPPVMGERDAVIQRADALRKAGKINEALDLYRHAATLPTPQV